MSLDLRSGAWFNHFIQYVENYFSNRNTRNFQFSQCSLGDPRTSLCRIRSILVSSDALVELFQLQISRVSVFCCYVNDESGQNERPGLVCVHWCGFVVGVLGGLLWLRVWTLALYGRDGTRLKNFGFGTLVIGMCVSIVRS